MGILIRPHHGMCLAFFAGRGYSDSFTAHMAQVRGQLRQGAVIRLKCGVDDICGPCPNNCAGQCGAAGKVNAYDAKVLELCGLQDGQELDWHDFELLVKERILCAGLRQKICGDCQWDRICREFWQS